MFDTKTGRSSSGFTLVEVIVATFLLLVVLSAATPLLVNGIKLSASQQRSQGSVAVAGDIAESVRSRIPSGGDGVSAFVAGRAAADVSTIWGRHTGAQGVADTVAAHDASNPSTSAAAVIPPTQTITRQDTPYRVDTLVGTCQQHLVGTEYHCDAGGTGATMVRVIIFVDWQGSSNCKSGSSQWCDYQTTSLYDTNSDQEWAD
jgi:prepilin-type N-terminal cleavage/methylation domain-containing protein